MLGVYLATWLERIKPPHGTIKVSTWTSYESHARVHLLTDSISERRVSDLTTTDVEDLFRRLLYKGLSPASVVAVQRTLRRALNAHPKVTVNPVRGASSPRVPRPEVDVDLLWTHELARRFLAYAEGRDADMAALVRLALDSGARLGELLPRSWGEIDSSRQTVRLRRSAGREADARRRTDAAVRLAGAGLDVVAVSERLGHWSPSLTLSVYAHAIRGRQRELAQAIGAALR
jgi:integrase